MRTSLRALAAFALALGLQTAQAALPLPGPVVDAAWLAANRDAVQVVEVRSNTKSALEAPEVEKDAKTGKPVVAEVGGRIPGSRMVDFRKMRTAKTIDGVKVSYLSPEKAEFEAAIRAAGIDAGKPIVLVPLGADVVDLDDALYVYWQLKSFGEDAVAVLDGGMAGWLLEGRPFTVEPVADRTGTWIARADRRARYDASSLDVAAAVARRDATLVDARDARMYHGLTKRDYVQGYGRIDGARHLPPELLTRAEQGVVRLYRPETYRAVLADRGIPVDAPAISYCNSGQLASGPWFVMSELLGNRAARMYDGSLHQWTLEKRTLVGAAPR